MVRLIAFLRRLFAPQGNLLTTDILVEIHIALLSNGDMKTNISKFQDNPHQAVGQSVVQGLINATIGFAKERRISIRWDAVAAMHPPYEEHANEMGVKR